MPRVGNWWGLPRLDITYDVNSLCLDIYNLALHVEYRLVSGGSYWVSPGKIEATSIEFSGLGECRYTAICWCRLTEPECRSLLRALCSRRIQHIDHVSYSQDEINGNDSRSWTSKARSHGAHQDLSGHGSTCTFILRNCFAVIVNYHGTAYLHHFAPSFIIAELETWHPTNTAQTIGQSLNNWCFGCSVS